MVCEPFAVGRSILHRLDPRIRVGAAIAISFTVALSRHFPALLGALGLSLVLALLARLSPAPLLKRLAAVNGIVLVMWVLVPLTFPGKALYSMGPLDISREGVLLAAQITLKSNSIILALIALVATMPISTLGCVLHRLRVPAKLVHLVLMSYHYLFVLEHEYERRRRAAEIKGFQPRTNLQTYRAYAWLVGMLFVGAAMRAERVQQAMLCRGFHRKFVSLEEFKAGAAGWAFGLAVAAALLALVAVQWVPWD